MSDRQGNYEVWFAFGGWDGVLDEAYAGAVRLGTFDFLGEAVAAGTNSAVLETCHLKWCEGATVVMDGKMKVCGPYYLHGMDMAWQPDHDYQQQMLEAAFFNTEPEPDLILPECDL